MIIRNKCEHSPRHRIINVLVNILSTSEGLLEFVILVGSVMQGWKPYSSMVHKKVFTLSSRSKLRRLKLKSPHMVSRGYLGQGLFGPKLMFTTLAVRLVIYFGLN